VDDVRSFIRCTNRIGRCDERHRASHEPTAVVYSFAFHVFCLGSVGSADCLLALRVRFVALEQNERTVICDDSGQKLPECGAW
jgi:hypothetical protein